MLGGIGAAGVIATEPLQALCMNSSWPPGNGARREFQVSRSLNILLLTGSYRGAGATLALVRRPTFTRRRVLPRPITPGYAGRIENADRPPAGNVVLVWRVPSVCGVDLHIDILIPLDLGISIRQKIHSSSVVDVR